MEPTNLDPHAIRSAERALEDYLSTEAEQQKAYLFRFPDGRVSVELEWIDLSSAAQKVVGAYLAFLNRDQSLMR
jgi:hypothetical protein